MTLIPFLDLKLINNPYLNEINDEFKRVVESGWFVLGKSVEHFEKLFSNYNESTYCVGVANGLDALHLILKSFDFPANSEVIVPANTYYASILSIQQAGLTPVLVEPNLETYLLNEDLIEDAITPQTKAILFVELYGKTGNLEKLSSIANKHNLKLICDAAQSHGVLYQGNKTSKWFDAQAFSFYPTKNLGAMGDAGCIITNDSTIYEKVVKFRNYGSSKKYVFEYAGLNSRLDELQAVVLNVKLADLDRITEIRRGIANRYLIEIKNPAIVLPKADRVFEDVWHLFTIRVQNREHFISYLMQNGVSTDVHYPIAPHKQKALSEFNGLHLPITELIHQQIVSLPLNQSLTFEQQNQIITLTNSYSQ